MGDDSITSGVRQKLEQDLNYLRALMTKMLTFNEESLNLYENSMQNSIDEVKTYFNETDLIQMHQKTKDAFVIQVCV